MTPLSCILPLFSGKGSRQCSWEHALVIWQFRAPPALWRWRRACTMALTGSSLLERSCSFSRAHGFPAFSIWSLPHACCSHVHLALGYFAGVIAIYIRVYLSLLTGGGEFNILLCCCHLVSFSRLDVGEQKQISKTVSLFCGRPALGIKDFSLSRILEPHSMIQEADT